MGNTDIVAAPLSDANEKTLQNTALFLMMYSGRSHRKCRSFLFR